MSAELPRLRDLGHDLLHVPPWRVAVGLALPFALLGGYILAACAGHWALAVVAVAAITFFTYGSVSHDLVHRSLGLPAWANEWFLCIVELMALRSGHAYRAGHLHHHARFPEADDVEGAAARMTWFGALRDGLTLQVRIWRWAVQRKTRHRAWIWGEGIGCLLLVLGSVAVAPITPVPIVYVALAVGGSWFIPLVTSYLPHDPTAEGVLRQTRAFRGWTATILAIGHLYHLEHHLYPNVPHHNWARLAKRLDPYLQAAGVRPRRLTLGWRVNGP